jgi:uncharacterized protein (TIGR03435 family)
MKLAAQPDEAGPAFEVASIKPHRSGENGERFVSRRLPLDGYPVAWMTGWMSSEYFELSRNPETKTEFGQMPKMLHPPDGGPVRSHVSSRTREMTGYALIVARNGPKIPQSSEGLCKTLGMPLGTGEFVGCNVELPQFIYSLRAQLNRPVVDKAGPTGTYDFDFHYMPDGKQPDDPNTPPRHPFSRPFKSNSG